VIVNAERTAITVSRQNRLRESHHAGHTLQQLRADTQSSQRIGARVYHVLAHVPRAIRAATNSCRRRADLRRRAARWTDDAREHLQA
jgi:hypothetical protein